MRAVHVEVARHLGGEADGRGNFTVWRSRRVMSST